MTVAYVRWNDGRVEYKRPNEDKDIEKVVQQITNIQKKTFAEHGHAFGTTHVKTQGLCKGTIKVKENLPPHLAQGLFSNLGKEYPVAMRYSTETTARIDDRVPQPRGLAFKIFEVDGPKLRPDGKDPRTHDLEFNSAPVIELRDAKTTAEIIGLRIANGDDTKGLDADLKKRDDYELQDARNHIPNVHMAAMNQYSQSAYRHGDYIAKYRVIAVSDTLKAFQNCKVEQDGSPHVLSEWLKEYYKDHEAVYDLQAQILTEDCFKELDEKAVEDAGLSWDHEKYPYETVATVTVPVQDSFIHARRVFWENNLRLDPWHGLVEHTPLGSTNRLRRIVYQASSAARRMMVSLSACFKSLS